MLAGTLARNRLRLWRFRVSPLPEPALHVVDCLALALRGRLWSLAPSASEDRSGGAFPCSEIFHYYLNLVAYAPSNLPARNLCVRWEIGPLDYFASLDID